ncbi:MAG TPA: class I SAM-dependent methyltransferase [Saprospiraceae bacterium]|nr:class I SAM-dependent methyltransferase [Saprospiraceae bacterium]
MNITQFLNIDEFSDKEFDKVFKPKIRFVSEIHFTPVEVAKSASQYLTNDNTTRILDIGSGCGKFCFVGAITTNGIFTGIELRKSFHDESEKMGIESGLQNLHFIHANIMDISFEAYDAFYIFNPFQENISVMDRINDEIPLNRALYDQYSAYVEDQLDKKPSGTKLATYFSYRKEVPPSYQKVSSHFGDKLVFWEKK